MKSKMWDEQTIQAFQTTLLNWYHRNKRNLPWRADTDPYKVWISEIMLQQTRVDTVIDYYYRFMEEFPTIKALAQADEEKLLKVWQGLGYYSRARNLKVAANQIQEEFDGKFPNTVKEIRSLKGIGPYTAGAISSISFGLPEPAIDGNVMRVISRLFGIEEDITKASTYKIFDQILREIISHEQPGDMNQALMEVGATVSTPSAMECPAWLKPFCYACAHNEHDKFPVKTKKAKPKDVYYLAGVIENANHEYLVIQRPENGLLAKMWHFPLEEVEAKKYQELKQFWQKEVSNQISLDLVAEDEDIAPSIFNDWPIVWQKRHFGEVTHVFSHLKWHVLIFYGRSKSEFTPENGQWLTEESFSSVAFPKIQQKIRQQFNKSHKVDGDL
ncbi:A/G-specific adenine glycosylase [Tetragenococcus osmophilus]|uniref:Adenine DNA glycosylase n=1 Tax=Tetragenococcus osmophilus TaxID=526944 RepID=A0AA37XKK8_9ENTE|nr:A/G-specific adenine glycosylase [Tetragenococcus osmophilus]AYW48362.1 A/G-specific adenine glycosylase [Tetragenococcus osmophilus]GMA54188.1 A/G-specific adenine glycosylase [Alicyclobacillus contaminans]GMA71931.1 A/G-specific adenine glycosylase [Tetragenococcus osmophilus]